MIKKSEAKGYLMVLPAVGLAVLFFLYPLAKSFLSSFLIMSQDGSIKGFAGLANYIRLFSSASFRASISHTLLFALMFVPLNTVLTLLAASLTRRRQKGSSVFEYVFFSPMGVSLSAYALIFREIFRGRVSIASRIIGQEITWLESPETAMRVLVILGVFLDFGIDYMLLLSAYRSIDRSIIDAARMDGASGGRMLWQIELPIIKPMLSITVFLALKDALLISAPVMILTGGGPFRSTETVMYYYYLEGFRSGNRAVANTISVLAVLLSIIAMSTVMMLRRRHAR